MGPSLHPGGICLLGEPQRRMTSMKNRTVGGEKEGSIKTDDRVWDGNGDSKLGGQSVPGNDASKQDSQPSAWRVGSVVKDEGGLMESLMEFLVGRRASNDKSLLPFSAPTYAQVRRAFSDWVRAIYRLEVVGADRLPVIGPAIVASNHASVLDGIVLGAAISRELRFLAKAELWRSRLLAWMLEGLGAIPIVRGRSDHLALAQVRQALNAGQAVAIFPQGAVRGDRVWHRGAARLALVTGAPLVPARLVGTAQALSRGRIGLPRLRVIIGEPIEVAQAEEDPVAAAELTERLRVAVESLA